MPKPTSGETEKDFISRCMSFPDMQKYDQEQRLAICYNTFREARNMESPVRKAYNRITKNIAGVHDALMRNGVTTTSNDHSHSFLINRDGDGATSGMVGEDGVTHIHDIKNHEVMPAQEHIHLLI